MSTPPEPPESKNLYVMDSESAGEMARLMNQDILATKNMGGLLAERPDFANIHDILDLACGPGGWVMEVAFAQPEIQVVGVDISQRMIEYAQVQALVQRLDNAHFMVIDIMQPLDFSDASFDLVNARTISFLPPTAWPKLIQECMRITRPGGLIRLTEGEGFGITNSAALSKLDGMLTKALLVAGQSFSPDGRSIGITPMLGHFLHEAGCQNIQSRAHAIDFSAWTEAHNAWYHHYKISLKLLQPFLIRVGVTTQEEQDELYDQLLMEMLSPDFCAVAFSLTVMGEKP